MLNGARSSAPFAKVNNLLYDFFFFSTLLMLFFFALGNSNDLPTFFFIDSHATRSACCALSYKWLMFKCVGLHKSLFILLSRLEWETGLSDLARKVPRPQSRHARVVVMKRMTINRKQSWNRVRFSYFEKYFTTFLNVKVHDAPSEWNERKKEIFVFFFFFIVITDIFLRDFNFTCNVH